MSFLTKRSIQKFIRSIVRSKSHSSASAVGPDEISEANFILLGQHPLERERAGFARARGYRALEQPAGGFDAQLQRGTGNNLVVRPPGHGICDRRGETATAQNDFRVTERLETDGRRLEGRANHFDARGQSAGVKSRATRLGPGALPFKTVALLRGKRNPTDGHTRAVVRTGIQRP